MERGGTGFEYWPCLNYSTNALPTLTHTHQIPRLVLPVPRGPVQDIARAQDRRAPHSL